MGQALTVETDRAFIFQRHIAHIKPLKSRVNPDYLVLNLNSSQQYAHAKEVARGAAQPTVTLTDLKQFEIPLPPLAEQQEIVRRVSALFARADAIEAAVAAARKRVDALTQAVLAKAFRGELVPTEADLARRENRFYEPAAALLARLRATTTTVAKPKGTRKAKGTPAP